jgi:hypothetical protein
LDGRYADHRRAEIAAVETRCIGQSDPRKTSFVSNREWRNGMETVVPQGTEPNVDTRRIAVCLGLTFGLDWLTGLVIYLTGGLVNSPKIGPVIPLAVILLAIPYMWAPAIAFMGNAVSIFCGLSCSYQRCEVMADVRR